MQLLKKLIRLPRMITSIKDDISRTFSHGNMVHKLIIINVAVFAILTLVEAFSRPFSPSLYSTLESYLAVGGSFPDFVIKPWTWFTYMFVHGGFWHLVWNMVALHIFGRIVGDLLGDRRILPLYIIGGLVGALLFIIYANVSSLAGTGYLVGASAGVMCIAVVAGITAPDYNIRLLLIGDVKIKWIVALFIFLDLIGTQGTSNTGGHYAHLGGIIAGALYVYRLRNGHDHADFWNRQFDKISSWGKDRPSPPPRQAPAPRKKAPLKVKHRSSKLANKITERPIQDPEMYLDFLLEKIKRKGIESLTEKERKFLDDASKQ